MTTLSWWCTRGKKYAGQLRGSHICILSSKPTQAATFIPLAVVVQASLLTDEQEKEFVKHHTVQTSTGVQAATSVQTAVDVRTATGGATL